MNKKLNCIILNSGRGSRLGVVTTNSTKCMAKIYNDKTILSLQLEKIKKVGLEKVYLTIGYLSNLLEDYIKSLHCSIHISFVNNKNWSTTNYIASLDCLNDSLFDDDVLLLHGDLVFSDEVLSEVIDYHGSCVVVDSTIPLPEKDFKARIDKNGIIKEIGVKTFGDDCMACQPLYKLTLTDWKLWQKSIHEFCQRGETGVYAENALNIITDKVHIHALDVKGKLCMEIDDQKDLSKARELLKKETNNE